MTTTFNWVLCNLIAHLTFQTRKVLVTRNLTLDVLRWWRGHETNLFSWLCCLRYLMASSMQIQRREGLGDMQWGHRGLCLMKNSELSLIPIITHEKIFQPFLDLLQVRDNFIRTGHFPAKLRLLHQGVTGGLHCIILNYEARLCYYKDAISLNSQAGQWNTGMRGSGEGLGVRLFCLATIVYEFWYQADWSKLCTHVYLELSKHKEEKVL